MHPLAKLDHQFVWHPFTQMRDWLKREPVVIVAGNGAVLRDVRGREYLDANSSIWTNLHGHHHPKLDAAIRRQLGKIAHSSALGLANEPASILARELVAAANHGIYDLRYTIYEQIGSRRVNRKSQIHPASAANRFRNSSSTSPGLATVSAISARSSSR